MSTQSLLNLIDIESMPAWDLMIRVRGMELPAISPMNANSINTSPIPEQAQIDASMKRWPGIGVWLWRAIFGSPRLHADKLPRDGGLSHARMVCMEIFGYGNSALIEDLSGGECASIITAYMGYQDEWMHAWGQRVRERASEHLRTKEDSAASVHPAGFETLVPGQVKFKNQRHPNIIDGGVDDAKPRNGAVHA